MHLERLKAMTLEKRYDGIYNYLNMLEQKLKGPIFSKYLGMLYEGNGINSKVTDNPYDKGCDILLYKHESTNPFMIIQCKNQQIPLSKKEIASEINQFETEGKRKYDCGNYILVSLNGFVRNGEDFKGLSNVKLENWSYVMSLIANYSADSNPKVPHVELYEHNQSIFKQALRLLNKHNRVAIIQATGTGKSYIAEKLMTMLPEYRAVYISPSHYINNQFRNMTLWCNNIDYVTYSGLSKYLDNTYLSDKTFIILDEFHRAGAEEWGKNVLKLINSNPNHKFIGLSATQIRQYDGYRDMTKELFDGIQTEELTVFQAIARGILPDPIYVTAIVTLKNDTEKIAKDLIEKGYTQSECQKVLSKLHELDLSWRNGIGISSMLSKYVTIDYNKLIVFCKNENHIDEIQGKVIEWFSDLKIFKYINAQKIMYGDKKRNQRVIDEFECADDENTLNILFSVNLLNEGLHIKNVSMLMFLRDTESFRVYYQQLGRGLESGKKIKPIVFDMVDNFSCINEIAFTNKIMDERKRVSRKRKEVGLSYQLEDFVVHDETRTIYDEFMKTVKMATEEIENNRVFLDENKDIMAAGYKLDKNELLKHKGNCRFNSSEKCGYISKMMLSSLIYRLKISEEETYQYVTTHLNNINDLFSKVVDFMNIEKVDIRTALEECIDDNLIIDLLRIELYNADKQYEYMKNMEPSIVNSSKSYIFLIVLKKIISYMENEIIDNVFLKYENKDKFFCDIKKSIKLYLSSSIEEDFFSNVLNRCNGECILDKNFILRHYYLGFENLIRANKHMSCIVEFINRVNSFIDKRASEYGYNLDNIVFFALEENVDGLEELLRLLSDIPKCVVCDKYFIVGFAYEILSQLADSLNCSKKYKIDLRNSIYKVYTSIIRCINLYISKKIELDFL